MKSFICTSGPWITNSTPLSVILKNPTIGIRAIFLKMTSLKVLEEKNQDVKKRGAQA